MYHIYNISRLCAPGLPIPILPVSVCPSSPLSGRPHSLKYIRYVMWAGTGTPATSCVCITMYGLVVCARHRQHYLLPAGCAVAVTTCLVLAPSLAHPPTLPLPPGFTRPGRPQPAGDRKKKKKLKTVCLYNRRILKRCPAPCALRSTYVRIRTYAYIYI